MNLKPSSWKISPKVQNYTNNSTNEQIHLNSNLYPNLQMDSPLIYLSYKNQILFLISVNKKRDKLSFKSITKNSINSNRISLLSANIMPNLANTKIQALSSSTNRTNSHIK